jgi:hypothetical protein
MDEKDFTKLRERMDADMNLYRLESFVMRGSPVNGNPGKVITGATNITLNDPMVFGDAFISVMQMDKCTREVQGIDESYQRKIEEDLKHWLYLNDELLCEKQMESLDDCLNFQAGFRGWLCGLPLIKQSGDDYQVSIIPTDSRWCKWENGERGLKKFSYSLRMDKEEAEEIFKQKLEGKKVLYLECTWDDKRYTVSSVSLQGTQSTEEQELTSVLHGLDFCPGVVVPVPKVPYLVSSSENYATELSYQGESIYAPSRETISQMNDIASVLASMNKQQFLAPLVIKTERGIENFGDGAQFYGGATVSKLEPLEEIIRVPIAELKASMTFLYEKLWASFERSLFSSVNFGQAGDRQSAIAIADLKSDRDKIISPRRKAKSTFMRKCFKNLARMAKGNCYKTTLDEDYTVKIDKKLYEQKFTIQVSYSSITPQENIANVELAQRYANMGYPSEWIMKNITHEDNPSDLTRQKRLDELYKMIPQAMMYDAMMADAPQDLTEEQIKYGRMLIIKAALEKQLDMAAGTLPGQTQTQVPSQPSPQPVGMKSNSNKLASEKLKQTGQQGMIEARRGQNG